MSLNNFIQQYKATLIAAIIAILVLGSAFIADYDLLKIGRWLVEKLSAQRIDDVLAAIFILFIGFVIDQIRVSRQIQADTTIQENRLRVLKATMRTVQDIVNNFLNNMQLVELECDETLSPETKHLIQSVRKDATEKLKALSDLQSTPEIKMAIGTGIDYNPKQNN